MPVLWDPQEEHLGSRGSGASTAQGWEKANRPRETLGQSLRPRNGGVRVWAATILSHRGGKPRDQAGGDGQSQSLHASLSDSACCSWLPREGLCEVKEAVFSRNNLFPAHLPRRLRQDNSCEAERAKEVLGFCYGEKRGHTLGTQAEMTSS